MTNKKAKKILDVLARKVVLCEGKMLGLRAVIVCQHIGLMFKYTQHCIYNDDIPKLTVEVLNAHLREDHYSKTFFVNTYKDALDKMLELSKKGFDIVIGLGINNHVFMKSGTTLEELLVESDLEGDAIDGL